MGGAALAALIADFAVLQLIQYGIAWLWEETPEALGGGPLLWGYVVRLPVAAGFVVAALRRRYNGHNQLAGFAIAPLSLADFPFALGAILVTPWGGLVLGPEVAMITAGSFVGPMFGRGLSSRAVQLLVGIGAFFGILALAVRPVLSGSQRLARDDTLAAANLILAAGVAAVTAAFVAAVRLFAHWLQRMRGGDPAISCQIGVGGGAVGGLARAYHLLTDEPVYLILTSGEGYLQEITADVGGAGPVDGGHLDAGVRHQSGIRLPGRSLLPCVSPPTRTFVAAAATAGIIAATVSLAHAGWAATLGIGLGIGWIVGGFALLPVAVVGALIGRLVPHPTVGGSGGPPQSTGGGTRGGGQASSGD